MLFKLATKNIQKSIKDYAIYFFTLVLGVAVFYVFNSIGKQTAMLEMSKSGYEIVKLLSNTLSGVSVFVSFVLGFLIIYASRFLIKRRKKEFGVYMTLGMGKMKISRILLCETLLIGLISLVIGLCAGIFLSQVMSAMVSNMFEADLSQYRFVYSGEATIKTILYFSIMYLMVMIFNVFSISKCKLIDLLQAGRKNEKIKNRNPYVCILLFVIATLLLGWAYYKVTLGYEKMNEPILYASIICGALGTFLMFWSLSGLILKIVRSMRGIYRKNLNTFLLRQVDSKINTTVFSMTIICLMLFLTIGILSTALALNDSLRGDLKTLAPVDIQFYSKWETSEYSAGETLERQGFTKAEHLNDMLEFNTYSLPEVTIEETLGRQTDELLKQYPYLIVDSKVEIIRLSDYNKFAELSGQDTLSLEKNEYLIVANYKEIVKYRDKALADGKTITIKGKNYVPREKNCVNGFLIMSNSEMNLGVIVVPDDAVDESMKYKSYLTANYKADTKEGKMKTENKLQGSGNEEGFFSLTEELDGVSRITLYESSVGLGAIITFIGLYLGIVFLISSAAILALKELSDSTDNKERYEILRRIGTDEKMIRRSLFWQIGIFFLFPLLLAIIHSVFGIWFVNKAMIAILSESMLPSIVLTAVLLMVIYGGYFLITYLCSWNIIRDKK